MRCETCYQGENKHKWNTGRCDSHTLITYKLCDTYHGRFQATLIYAAACSPQKERLYFKFYVKKGR